MLKFVLLVPFLLSCNFVRITPKACGTCNQKGGVVIVSYKGVDYDLRLSQTPSESQTNGGLRIHKRL